MSRVSRSSLWSLCLARLALVAAGGLARVVLIDVRPDVDERHASKLHAVAANLCEKLPGRGARRRARPRRRRARHVPPPRDGAAPVHKLLDVRTRGGGPGDAGEDIHGARRRLRVAARRLLGRVRLPGSTEEAHWAPRLAVLRAAAGRTRISCAPRSLGAIRPRGATRVTLTLFGAFVRKESSRETLAQGKYGESRRRSSWRGPGCSSPT